MFTRWSLWLNDLFGIPHSGWGEDFPSVPIILAAFAMTWVTVVTLAAVKVFKETKS